MLPTARIWNRKQQLTGALMVLFRVWLVAIAAGCTKVPTPVLMETSTATATPVPEMERESWVLLNNLPEGANQVETGAEIYRLVCKVCHGDQGQGLTSDWLAQWPLEDRNCWQSKCHAENHPPDGFLMPIYVPPVTGPQIAASFPSALELYNYNRSTMPWQVPGTMLDQEYWNVTAYLLSINGVELGETLLEASNAETIRLP